MPLLTLQMMLSRRFSTIGRMKRRVTLSAPNTLTANYFSQSES